MLRADNRSVDQREPTPYHRVGYWTCAAGLGVAAGLTVVPERWFIQIPLWYVWFPLGQPLVWWISYNGIRHFAPPLSRKHWWFIVVTAPLALFYLAEGMLTMGFRMFNGFAP
jgi:hypothetical protein